MDGGDWPRGGDTGIGRESSNEAGGDADAAASVFLCLGVEIPAAGDDILFPKESWDAAAADFFAHASV